VSALALVPSSQFPRLSALIVGEGVLNDALSIVLFDSLLNINAMGPFSGDGDDTSLLPLLSALASSVVTEVLVAFVLGVACSLASARLLKLNPTFKEHPPHQVSLVLLFAYLSYSIAEAAGVSGILTLFISSILQSHYAWHSLSEEAQVATKTYSAALAEIAEAFAFAYVGLSLWDVITTNYHFQFSFFMIAALAVSRLLTILVLCFVFRTGLPLNEQLGFTLGGMVRGCLCWAQILQVLVTCDTTSNLNIQRCAEAASYSCSYIKAGKGRYSLTSLNLIKLLALL
jgi:sodium/hydrogen exchanger-like protein 6/7